MVPNRILRWPPARLAQRSFWPEGITASDCTITGGATLGIAVLVTVMLVTFLLVSAALMPLSDADAEPALWYRWQSKVTGNYICRPHSPGDGWQLHSGPYADGGCRKKVRRPPTDGTA